MNNFASVPNSCLINALKCLFSNFKLIFSAWTLAIWHKKNSLGLGSWLRSNAEFCFLIQKYPQKGKVFKNRSFGNVWEEAVIPSSKRKHPHQKPKELIKALIETTTEKGDLIIDPCAGSFAVLEVCQELKREFCGVDLSFREMEEFRRGKR